MDSLDTSEQTTSLQDSAAKKGRRVQFRVHPLQVLGIVALLVIWEAAAFYVMNNNPERGKDILPSIESVFGESLPQLATFYGFGMGGSYAGAISDYPKAFAVIAFHSGWTILRLLAGTLLGAFLGILVGLAMSWSVILRAMVQPVILLLRTIPILALIPLFLAWFGGREVGNIVYIAFAVFSILVINTIEAVRNVPPIYIDYARTMGASRAQIYRTVIIPAIVPELTGGIRVVLGLAFAITLAAEYLFAQSGLGRIMILSERFLFTGRMIVVVILFMIYSVLLSALFLRLSRRMTRWQPN
ncbi:MAG: ABC transporter permease [Caldilineaceae bacterium]|nr:ABC transporter permease [Caldilineaceae bacterium]